MLKMSVVGQRAQAAVLALVSGAATLAMVAVVPYLLWQIAGVPWPDRVQSASDLVDRLMTPVGDPLLVQLLAAVAWCAWAAFTLSLLYEAAWYVTRLPQLYRDRGLHTRHLEALTVRRSLAALCVGTLIVALVALWCPQPVAASTPYNASLSDRAAVTTTAPLHSARADGDTEGSVGMEVPRCVEYTVVRGDTLWDIAAAHLGDPIRWPRIYALNKSRVQADGSRLEDPDLILPGWRLRIPVAAGSPSQQCLLPPPPAHERPAPSVQLPDGRAEGGAEPSPPGHGRPEETPPASARAQEREKETKLPRHDWARGQREPVAISIGTASVIGITTAAGIAAALALLRVRQRRTLAGAATDTAVDAELPALASTLRTALFADRAAHQPEPADGGSVSVDAGDERIERVTPKQPGAPGTVTIGTRDGQESLLEELARPGGIHLAGPGAQGAARALVLGVLTAAERTQLAIPHTRLCLSAGLAYALLGEVPDRLPALLCPADIGEVIGSVETHLLQHLRHSENTADQSSDSTSSAPGDLVVLVQPDAATNGHVAAIAARCAPGRLTVITLGERLPKATVLTVDTMGSCTFDADDPMPESLFTITQDAVRDVLGVLYAAHDLTPPAERTPPTAIMQSAPAPAPGPAPGPGHAPEADRAPVGLRVLGPLTLVRADTGELIATGLREEVRELLALLAAHPTGLRAEEIALHLRLPDDPQRALADLKNMRRAVRRALRPATESDAEFIQLNAEYHKLAPNLISTDIGEFQKALQKAAQESDESRRMLHLRTALGCYAGPFADGSDYPWSEGIREALHRKAADAAARLAEYTARSGDIDGALHLLDEAITASPTDELLYQRTIRIQLDAGREDAAQRTYDLLAHHLKALGHTPAATTRALLRDPAGTRHRG
ncbi:BTAD domain-containing putative transcriptional regulator [Streptomyces sp. NPDC050738]|uniref:BTAD domain-containing putative transcriptional regulator n=1 Tax=Streptomyces sp. NPDC050738 TaxID=3154744 RepID=UPI0034146A71